MFSSGHLPELRRLVRSVLIWLTPKGTTYCTLREPCFSYGRLRDAEQRRGPCPVVGRFSQFNFADVFQAAVKENLLRCCVARVGIRPDSLETEGPEPVIDDGCSCFPSISVAP